LLSSSLLQAAAHCELFIARHNIHSQYY
jgi:hypothetical protein